MSGIDPVFGNTSSVPSTIIYLFPCTQSQDFLHFQQKIPPTNRGSMGNSRSMSGRAFGKEPWVDGAGILVSCRNLLEALVCTHIKFVCLKL